jgi:hypothetical protein
MERGMSSTSEKSRQWKLLAAPGEAAGMSRVGGRAAERGGGRVRKV